MSRLLSRSATTSSSPASSSRTAPGPRVPGRRPAWQGPTSPPTASRTTGIWTAPGVNPAYIMVEVALMGTGGLSVLGAGEAVIRTRFEGMTTDQTRKVHLYGVDFAPGTGIVSDRDFGTIFPDPGAPVGAVKGRWRFRPPCDPFGTTPAKQDKTCVMNAANTFLPPPREVRAVIEGAWLPGQTLTAANGITWGQYR